MEANNNPPHNSGPPAAGAGWLPSAVRKGSSALAQGDAAHRRVQVACRQCKAAKAKCDMSRPCRRCLYRGAGDECAPAGGDEEPAGDADDAPEPSKRAKRPRAAAYEPRDGGPRGGAKHRTGAPANGDEYFDVSLPDLMVLAVSPALAQRYTRTPFAGPAGTFLLAWVYEPDVAKVLTQMLRCLREREQPAAANRTASQLYGAGARDDVIKLTIIRSLVAELHECTLQLSPQPGNVLRMHVCWRGSIHQLAAVYNEKTAALDDTTLRSVQECVYGVCDSSGAPVACSKTLSFDELRSSHGLFEYASHLRQRLNLSSTSNSFLGHMLQECEASAQKQSLLNWSFPSMASKVLL